MILKGGEFAMEIYRGTKRLVIVFCGLAVKFPWSKTRIPWFMIRKHPISSFMEKVGWGIWENWQEFITWVRLRPPFLTPVYLSFGIILIQKKAVGDPINWDEFMEAFGRIWERTNRQSHELNPHNFDEDNWIKSKWGYQMVDFGGRPSGLHLRTFMVRWRDVLEEELKC
jgi:hypothetical protein